MADESGVAARLKEARQARGLTVREWAGLLGFDVKPGQVTDVERGKQKPPQGMLAGAVQNAGIAPNWLLGGVGPMLSAGERADMATALAALQSVSLKVAAMKLDADARDLAQQWWVAVETGDVEAIQRLTVQAAGPPAERAKPSVDTELLSRAVAAVLSAAGGLKKPASPAVLASVVGLLYEMGGEANERAAAAALKLAGAA